MSGRKQSSRPVAPASTPATGKRLLVLLAAVFVIKLIVVLQLHDHPLLQPDAGLDTSAYATLAARVRAGDVLLGPGLFFVSPLYIYFLAAALALFDSFTAARVLQAALGTAAVWCVFIAAREWFGDRAAWMAAIAAALTGIFTFYEALLLQSALDPFLTAAALAALAIATSRPDGMPPTAVRLGPEAGPGRWFLLAGSAFGIQTLNRPNVLVPAVAIVLLLAAIRRFRGALLVAAGITIALAPTLARNVAVAGTWSPLPSHGGLNFYVGNNPDADGTYHSVPGITPNIAGQADDARRVVARALGHPVDDEQASAYFVRKALDWVRMHPGASATLFLKKLAYTFNAAHIPLNDSYTFYAYDMRTLLRVLVIGAWLLVPLGIVGLIVAAPRERLEPYLVWASFVPFYAVSVAIFFASDRYRVPLLVPLCIGAGAAVDAVVRTWSSGTKNRTSNPGAREFGNRRAREPQAAMLLCALFVFANWPVGLDDGRNEERTRMAEQFAAEGRPDQAAAWASRAEQGNPQPALVHFRVGRALLARHDAVDAVQHLERAWMLDPGRPETEYALGQALLDAGRPREAVPHLRAAVAAGVRTDVAGFDLARALAASGDKAGAAAALARVTPADPRDAASWLALGDLAVQLDAPALEQTFFSGAVSADPANATAHLNLAVVDAQQGRRDEAIRHAREALRLRRDYDKARQLLAALEGR